VSRPAFVASGSSSLSCCGTMLSLHFSVLLLLILVSLFPLVDAVCDFCFGEEPSCPGTGRDACPWNKTLTANAAALAAGTSLVVAGVLSSKLCRVFPKVVLDSIAALFSRPPPGTSFDCTNKSVQQIVTAIKLRHLSKQDAITHFAILGAGAADTADIKKYEFGIKAIEAVNLGATTSSIVEGAIIYVLYKLSQVVSSTKKGQTSFEFSADADEGSSSSSSGHSTTKSFSASLVRPSSEAAMFSLLNLFVGVCHALSLVNVLSMTEFLEDVVYEPVRLGVLQWPVAFECLVIYLRMLEAHSSSYKLKTIVHQAGGIDSIRAQALKEAQDRYSAAFFRTHGGNPLDTHVKGGGDKESHLYTGSLKGHNSNANKCCISWNTGTPHLAKNVDAKGCCKFLHACDQYVADKGPGGQCRGDHKRSDCDYPEDKRCKKPVQA